MKRLSPSFLAEYKNRKDDPFESLLARMAYRSKYQRKEDEGWWDTLRRVVEANVNLAPGTVTHDEMEFLYSSFYNMVTLPAGRGLFQGGTNMPTDAAYNCFSGSTEFYADGTRWTFQKAAALASQSFQVLCADGIERRATVRSFGVQPTQRVYFRPWHSRTKWRLSYDVTPSHRWLTENRGEVTDLKVGDRVKMVTPLHSIHTEDYADGFAHGMVYGDGCLRERGVPLKYQLRLCGAKKQHHEALRKSRYYRSFCSPPSYNGDPHLLLESKVACLKRLPPSDSGFDYVAGFICGVLAADGSRNKRVGTWQLSMQDEACVDYVLEHAHIVGLRPTGKNISGVLETNFGERKNPLVRATFTDKDIAFEVSKIDELEDQEVFCVVEPETQSFVLAGGLKTGNCSYITLREIKDWAWIARHAMCGVGVGVGYQEAHALPVVARRTMSQWSPKTHIACRPDHPDYKEVKPDVCPSACATNYVVEDTREGWSLALYYTLQAAWDGENCLIDVSKIRHRGSPLKTFGGTASGPGPLVDGLRAVDRIVRKAAGRRLSILECADITNLVGLMTKMGNIRRVALINISPWNREFLDAKTDASHSLTYRHTANNSVGLYTQADVDYVVANAMEIAERCATLGEPGFFNAVAARADSDPSVEGLNPCFSGDTLVKTRQGHFRIDDLVGKTVEVFDGTRWREVNTFRVTAENQPMLKITMHDGSHIRVTPYHKMVLQGQHEMVEARHLSPGDKLELDTSEETHGSLVEPGAYLKGFLLGDGTSQGGTAVLYLYPPKYVCEAAIISSALEVGSELWSIDASCGRQERRVVNGFRKSDGLIRWTTEVRREGLPREAFAWNLESKCKFIAGLMDADGSASDTRNGFLYQLSSVNEKLLRDVQLLLKTMGVRSHFSLMHAAGTKDFNDGYGEYETKDCFRLTLSQCAAKKLASLVKFERLVSFADKSLKYDVKPTMNKVVSIENDGVDEKVYCLVTEDPDRIAFSNGLIIGRCGEITLRSKDFCCIAEVNAPKLEALRWSDREKHLRAITRFLLRERLKPHTCPEAEKNRVETMRIGVGMMGVCDAMNLNYTACRNEVRLEATTYARDELRVSRPIKVTTVKPGGTVPTLANLDTPGMKSAHAPYSIRRARIGVHEPTAGALIEAGVRWEFDVTDPSNRTMVFEFPRKNDSGVYATRETPREQLERQHVLQRSWSDNAVSATINFPKGDVRALAGLIAEYVPKLKSSSFLPQCGGEYKQLPFEEISREEYEERAAEINEDHPLVWSDDAVSMEECQGNACPTR